MLNYTTFTEKMGTLAACLHERTGTVPEWSIRLAAYYQALQRAKLDECDFIEACDRLLFSDEWFPTVARIVAVADECARERRQSQRAAIPAVTTPTRLVCPYCHGARWLRRGGASPVKTKSGRSDGERILPCPHCTTDGRHDYSKEQMLIREEGGVPDPNGTNYMPDMSKTTWRLPRTADGRPDMEAYYQESRRLRGLPPGDDRPRAVPGWATFGDVLAGAMPEPQPEPTPEPVLVGAESWDDELTF